MFDCFVLLFWEENTKKTPIYYCYHFFVSYFHSSDILPGVSRRLSFADKHFCDILHRLYFANKNKKKNFAETAIIFPKINPLGYYLIMRGRAKRHRIFICSNLNLNKPTRCKVRQSVIFLLTLNTFNYRIYERSCLVNISG